mmetsp:Transcript_74094/g.211543  ORF Transcript_74094/g.211543 Transcript_74094/m.211543 type:complete len:324 (+) Transcript_74094:836-1807(+)
MLAILIDQVHGAVGATRNPQDLIRSDVDLDNRVRNARRDDGDRVLLEHLGVVRTVYDVILVRLLLVTVGRVVLADALIVAGRPEEVALVRIAHIVAVRLRAVHQLHILRLVLRVPRPLPQVRRARLRGLDVHRTEEVVRIVRVRLEADHVVIVAEVVHHRRDGDQMAAHVDDDVVRGRVETRLVLHLHAEGGVAVHHARPDVALKQRRVALDHDLGRDVRHQIVVVRVLREALGVEPLQDLIILQEVVHGDRGGVLLQSPVRFRLGGRPQVLRRGPRVSHIDQVLRAADRGEHAGTREQGGRAHEAHDARRAEHGAGRRLCLC